MLSRRSGAVVAPLLLLLAAGRVWLGAAQERCALADARHDDQLFMRLAGHLSEGAWLGPYDQLTLVKAPGYALWIAGNARLGIPLHLAETMLHLGACLVLVRAFHPLVASPVARSLLFALLLFNPLSFGEAALRFNRDAIYSSAVVLVVGCAVGMATRWRSAPAVGLGWALGLGAAVGSAFAIHEESAWLAPAVGLAYVPLALGIGRARGRGAAKVGLALLLPLAIGVTPAAWIARENAARYGVATLSEFRSDAFRGALGALSRVTHADERRYVPVPREARARLYPHSAALRELRPFLEGRGGEGWSGGGRRMLGLDADEARGEIPGIWFAWAIREAAARAGHHTSAREAERFYARLADEVDAACDAGAVSAGPRRRSVLPPWSSSHAGPTAVGFVRNLARLALLQGFETHCRSSGPEASLARFATLSRDRLAPRETPPDLGASGRQAWRLRAVDALAWTYRAVAGPLLLVSVPFIALRASRPRSRPPSAWMVAAGVLLLAMGARVAMLSYIEATFFNVNLRLLGTVYPLALAFLWLTASQLVAAGPSRRGGAGPR